jgi:hypothetical protein
VNIELSHRHGLGFAAHDNERLAGVEEKMGRLVPILEQLMQRLPRSVSVADEPRAAGPHDNIDPAERALRNARQLMMLRRLRDKTLGPDLFFDPAWNILIELYVAHGEGTSTTVGNACIAAGVPLTSALRCCQLLQDKRMVVRERDPKDGRRIFLRLSGETQTVLTHVFLGTGRAGNQVCHGI